MAQSLSFSSVCSFKAPEKPGVFVGSSVAGKVYRVGKVSETSRESKFQSLVVKATDSTKSSKPEGTKSSKKNTIVCPDCDGNGAILCSQCKGTGVNSVDHFNGQFKAGGLCWLCRGKRDILCGNCNGAGFLGGFMSTFDD